MDWARFGISIPYNRTSGQVKIFCPQCHDRRTDKRDKSLSINLETGMFHCHYCGFSGCAAESEKIMKNYFRPTKQVVIKPYSEKFIKYFYGRHISTDTLQKAKVTEGVEFIPQMNKDMNCIQFNYFFNGVLINTKSRDGLKNFKLIKDAELIPYNIDSVKGDYVIITEGEIDCLSYMEAGFDSVISVPNGANNNLSYFNDYMERFDGITKVYVASDSDTKGVILRNEIIRRFGAERCFIVTYGNGCKDANEHLVMYGADSLRQTIADAKDVKIDGVFTIKDIEDDLDTLFENGFQKGVGIGHPNFDELCTFEKKRLCIVTGVPGMGKSEFVDEMCERLNIIHGWKFAYFSPENSPLTYHVGKITEKLVGKKFGQYSMTRDEYMQLKQYMNENFFFICPEDNFLLDNILDKGKYLVRKYGIDGLIIDPYNKLEVDMGGLNETQYISRVLDKMQSFAQKNDVLVILVAHPTKMPKTDGVHFDEPNLYSISGSANFYNKADFGIIEHREQRYGEEVVLIDIQKVKFKWLGTPGKCHFLYDYTNGRFAPLLNAGDNNVVWDRTNHIVDGIKARWQLEAIQQQNDEAQDDFIVNQDDELQF